MSPYATTSFVSKVLLSQCQPETRAMSAKSGKLYAGTLLLLLSALGFYTLALTAVVLQACCMCVACRCAFGFHSLALSWEHSASFMLAVLLSFTCFPGTRALQSTKSFHPTTRLWDCNMIMFSSHNLVVGWKHELVICIPAGRLSLKANGCCIEPLLTIGGFGCTRGCSDCSRCFLA